MSACKQKGGCANGAFHHGYCWQHDPTEAGKKKRLEAGLRASRAMSDAAGRGRIRNAACRHACDEAGISTEALESGALAELIEAVTELSTTTGGLDYSVLAQLARRKLRPALAKLKGE